ncbi:hypothetical protein BDQ94DRAFT_141765 [Aspergillus welwitschiae]|uniref:Uncharacterized protein n=1 Tax=Aspergillus welwitschiae TaxID=1341132 RepID=A0A3F3Q5X9_9EURO|nr:hypothetical protein BDQ94DRAFT_141765 [Aspergillus welwitschiae]RDH34568.1 hypothetical protein BDQ94DRAFT_141765 [Aspergillus welwitschiae]
MIRTGSSISVQHACCGMDIWYVGILQPCKQEFVSPIMYIVCTQLLHLYIPMYKGVL